MSFEYGGAGISEVNPSSGMINIGNDRLVLSIFMESIGAYDSLVVTLLANSGETISCEIMEEPVDLQRSIQVTQIRVILPELQTKLAGMQISTWAVADLCRTTRM